ncbi:MAG: response regulator transcription factor [Elusimicrobia bacterium]|nr:response regulator transcription factor [Elusimicrobiota bacterium]
MPGILSVEDDPEFQQLVSRILRNQGFEVHYAFTGPEGYEKSLALRPDLILLDLMLPGLNGAEVIKLLKRHKETREIPVIVLTAYPFDAGGFETEIRALGPIEYLRKPVRSEELVGRIKRLLADRGGASAPPVLERGAFRLFPETRSARVGARMVANLGPKRFEVLFHLVQSGGELRWEDLVVRVWGPDGTKNDLEKTVSRLREDLGTEGYRLTTTRAGYQLIV